MASGAVRNPNDMVRFVLSPDGTVVADVFGKLPGRGVWVSSDAESLRAAATRGGFNRGFKSKLRVDADALIAQTHDQLRRRLLGQFAMARKAGQLSFGDTGVREPASRGEVAIRIEARDGADKARGKLRTLSLATARELNERGIPRSDPPVIGAFTAEEIGHALGRNPVVHAAILSGPMAKTIRQSAVRLLGFEPLIPPDWPDARHEAPVAIQAAGEIDTGPEPPPDNRIQTTEDSG